MSSIKLLKSVFFIIILLLTVSVYAVDDPFSLGTSSQSQGPTTITSKTMDIDYKNNVVTLNGDVFVDGPTFTVSSDKVVGYLTETNKESNSETGSKELSKLVALGNVIINKKLLTEKEKEGGKREATADEADYNLKTGVIVLTGNPILYQNNNFIKGDKITLWRDSDRVLVEGNQATGQTSKLVVTSANQLQGTTTAADSEKSK